MRNNNTKTAENENKFSSARINFFLNFIKIAKNHKNRRKPLFKVLTAPVNLKNAMNETTQPTETTNAEPAAAASPNDTLAAENSALRERIAHLSLERRLETAGALSPGLLSRSANSELQLSETGELLNADELVAEFKRRMPEQFRTEIRAESGIDAGTGTREASPALTREMLEQMPAERIAELDWQTVKRVLSGN